MTQTLTDFPGADIYRLALESVQDAVMVADRDGIIRLWNRGAEVLFGFTAQEAIGSPLSLLVPEKFRRAHDEGFRHAMASGHLRTEGRVLTTRSLQKFGGRLYVAFTFGLIKDAAGVAQGVVAVGRDVTAEHLEEVANKLRAAATA